MSLESYEEKYVEDMQLDELTKLVDGATCAQSKTSNNTAFIKPVDTENLKEVGELSTFRATTPKQKKYSIFIVYFFFHIVYFFYSYSMI